MLNEILIVFDDLTSANDFDNELKFNNSTVKTVEEIKSNLATLWNYKCILDCTNGNRIYSQMIPNSIMYSDYIETRNGSIIIMKGITYSRLTSSKLSPNNIELKKIQENDRNIYFNILRNLITKIPGMSNEIAFEEGLNSTGIILNNYIKDKNKVYLLVKTIPQYKEKNVVYITEDNLKLLSKLEDILKRQGDFEDV